MGLASVLPSRKRQPWLPAKQGNSVNEYPPCIRNGRREPARSDRETASATRYQLSAQTVKPSRPCISAGTGLPAMRQPWDGAGADPEGSLAGSQAHWRAARQGARAGARFAAAADSDQASVERAARLADSVQLTLRIRTRLMEHSTLWLDSGLPAGASKSNAPMPACSWPKPARAASRCR